MFYLNFSSECPLFRLFQDIDFFQHLEMHLRAEQPSLCGRDHLSYRSYYMPVKVSCFSIITMFCSVLTLVKWEI